MGRDVIDSMMSQLPSMPALLEHAGHPPPRSRASLIQVAIVLVAGCAHAAGIAWPFSFGVELGLVPGQAVWWLQLLSLMFLVLHLDGCRSWKRAAWLGWLFATAMQCATWWWLFISLHTYGGLASPLAVIAIVGLAAFLGLYYAAVCGAFMLLAPVNRALRAIVFAALWLLAELGRVALFTGFPWGEGGYAQLDGPFDGLAKLVGVHGLTFGAALAAAAVAGLIRRPRWLNAVAVTAGLLLAFAASLAVRVDADAASRFTAAYPAAASAAGAVQKPFTVTLLQGNIAQDEKFQGGKGIPDALNWYGSQLLAATSSLVVTPETAIPLLPAHLPENYLDTLANHFVRPAPGASATAAIIGIPLGNSNTGYTNSAIALKPQTVGAKDGGDGVYRYDKHHLVPFGEFVHPLFKWFLAIVNIPLADFNSGAVSQPSFDWQGQRLAPNICYEDLFGEELAARFRDPALSPTIFVNISNIAWFGNTIAIDQHLNISRMRALEFERPMIRATNTGATAIIDYRGQVVQLLERHTRGALVGEVEGRSGTTPYAWWASRFGLWPWWALIVLVLAFAVLGGRGRRKG
ncbi:Apolipoprotein N-acyltransferase [compost metagenome]